MVGSTLRNVVLGLIVFIWVVPFVALLTTSFRSELASQTSVSGRPTHRQSLAIDSALMTKVTKSN